MSDDAARAQRRKELAQTRVRDHLANERTYLAWLRTSANVMILGLAVAKFVDNLSSASIAAGVVLIVVGAVGTWYGTYRYRRVMVQIDEDTYDPDTRAYAAKLASTVLVVAMVTSLIVLITAG
jgi:putative membrane protein